MNDEERNDVGLPGLGACLGGGNVCDSVFLLKNWIHQPYEVSCEI